MTSGGTNEDQRGLDPAGDSHRLQLPYLPSPAAKELDLRRGDGSHERGLLRASDWPMRSRLELWALSRTVPEARRHTRRLLREWRLDGLAETAELLVSEIITNAVRASAWPSGGEFDQIEVDYASTLVFWLAADGQRVLIQVWDSCERKPERRQQGIAAESGRGLLLVDTLSAAWGSYVPNGSAGKVVWALVDAR